MTKIKNIRYAGKALGIGGHGIFDFDSDGVARVPADAADAVADLKGFEIITEPDHEGEIPVTDEGSMDDEPSPGNTITEDIPDSLTLGLREAAQTKGIPYEDFILDRVLLDEYSQKKFEKELDKRKSPKTLLDLVLEYERQATVK